MATIVQQPGLIRAGRAPLFLVTILTGSFLLFLVQPMIARMALPRLGGAPAVWNSAMLVYQALLLGGYAYAHAIGRLSPARQAMAHIALFAVAAIWLPIGLVAGNPPADADPVIWVPWLLALSIGPLFFAVAAQAPLMQRWYGLASGGRDPYALYAASNLGSFGGLLAYPLLVEPRMTVAGQSGLWSAGYGLLAVLVIACAWTLPRSAAKAAVVPAQSEKPALVRQVHWIALAAIPSGLMLSTTTHLTTDIVAMPLLWVIPLALYLLSFSVAFAGSRVLADAITRVAPLMILILGGFALIHDASQPLLRAGLSLMLLFVVSVALHTHMYRLRPAPDRLTGFYLAMSVGGVVGGLFSALLAPVMFDWTYEHPILILVAMLLAPQAHWLAMLRDGWGAGRRAHLLTFVVALATLLLVVWGISSGQSMLAGTVILILGALSIGRRVAAVAALAGLMMIFGGWQSMAASFADDARTRSYFGIYTIVRSPDEQAVRLVHGTTVHGIQMLAPGSRTKATSYYVPSSGVGRALALLPSLYGPNARIGIVGLGTGTLACYARPGQSWRFYEIDPAVVRIARDSGQFSFLSQCTPGAPVDIGDARLTLQAAAPASLDFLALDAFSSDAVPMHLLTREAFGIYRRALSSNGMLLVHISNRYLDLEPVIAAAAADGGWHATLLPYRGATDSSGVEAAASRWVAMAPRADVIARLVAAGQGDRSGTWRPVAARPGFAAWTDDFSSILPLVRAWAPHGDQSGAGPRK